MITKNMWIESYTGVGIVEEIITPSCEAWQEESDIVTLVIYKQFCNFDYKKSFRKMSCNIDLCNPLGKRATNKIEKMLLKDNLEEKFSRYTGKNLAMIYSIQFPISLDEEKIKRFKENLIGYKEFTMESFIKLFNQTFQLNLVEDDIPGFQSLSKEESMLISFINNNFKETDGRKLFQVELR